MTTLIRLVPYPDDHYYDFLMIVIQYLDVSEYLQEEGPEQIAFMPTLSHVSATWFSREREYIA